MRTRKDSAPVARIPMAARRQPSNSQKLITNLFHAKTKEKGAVPEIVAQWNQNARILFEGTPRQKATDPSISDNIDLP
uniref:Uncharacterized protein n=1 Tax=Vespula pensylvanica TaxID=30213 RepID=A0A834UA05_VESPE|nr:hypothetical protein H0235_007671 [Vespula pensylvanica]